MKNAFLALFIFCASVTVLVSCDSSGAAAQSPWDVSEDELLELLSAGGEYYLLDVRSAGDYADGHIPTAVSMPVDEIDASIAAVTLPNKDWTTVVYCLSGKRAATAKTALEGLGYSDVRNFGGISNWNGTRVPGSGPGAYQE